MPRYTAQQKENILRELEHSSISTISKKWKVSRYTIYSWKSQQQAGNLQPNYRRGRCHYKSLPVSLIEKIVLLVQKHPAASCFQLWQIAQKSNIKISYGSIEKILSKRQLTTCANRQQYAERIPTRFEARFRKSITATKRYSYIKEAIEGSYSIAMLSKRYGISRTTLYSWIKAYQSKGDMQVLENQYKKGSQHYKSLPQEITLSVLDAVIQNPFFSVKKLHSQLLARHTNVGYGTVQSILERYHLNKVADRLSYAGLHQNQDAVKPIIEPAVSPLHQQLTPNLLPAPPPGQRAVTSKSKMSSKLIFFFSFITSFLTTFSILTTASTFVHATSISEAIGYVFAFMALALGFIFFVYSFKYYVSVLFVLLLSRRTDKGNNKSGDSFSKNLIPDVSHIQLSRKPFVSIHLPLYNEKRVVDRLLTAVTALNYDNYEVIVCDDSTDETKEKVAEWRHHPKVKISHRDTREGYKGAALREAIQVMDPKTEFVMVFDADFIPFGDSIEQFLKYFQLFMGSLEKDDYKNNAIAAVQGYQWHVLNKSENWVTRGVRTEYAGSYVIERSSIEIYKGLKQIAGSVFMIRADLLKKFGWSNSITEDFDLTLRLYSEGYKVAYTPFVQAPSECVSTVKRLVRQRMRWAEGHSFNVKKMFGNLFSSPHLSIPEKIEFAFLAPFYLQSAFFLAGTFCWFIAEAVFQVRLPFWTEVWGWSLVLTNMLSLPLLNLVGLFLEEAEERDYFGLVSFLLLTYIVAPFQAYAAIKGFIEDSEGPWFRTPKTGRITDAFKKGKFYRWLTGMLPSGSPAKSLTPLVSGYQNKTISSQRIQNIKNNLHWNKYFKTTALAGLTAICTLLVVFSAKVPFDPHSEPLIQSRVENNSGTRFSILDVVDIFRPNEVLGVGLAKSIVALGGEDINQLQLFAGIFAALLFAVIILSRRLKRKQIAKTVRMMTVFTLILVISLGDLVSVLFSTQLGKILEQKIKDINPVKESSAHYQFSPTGANLVVGTEQTITSQSIAATEGTNVGSWRGTLVDDGFHWIAASTTSGIDMQMNMDGVILNGGNKMIIQTEVDLDATAPNMYIQICDWVSSTSVDTAADGTYCTTGGWRTINNRDATNTPIAYTDTANDSLQWHIYNGYFSTGATGGSAVSTPISNFIRESDGRVKIRYFSESNTTSQVAVDFLRVTVVIDPIYFAGGFTKTTGGDPVGTYANTNIIGNSATGQISVTAGDAINLAVPGTVGDISDFYLIFKNIETYTNTNTILVRADRSCSAATVGLQYRFAIRNHDSDAWENISGLSDCSTTHYFDSFALNNITVADYISDSSEIWIRMYANTASTTSLQVDNMYVMLGSTNTDTNQCEVSFGSSTAGRVYSNPSSVGADQVTTMTTDSTYMYVGGYETAGTTNNWRLEKRSLSTGALDTGFDTDGVLTVDAQADQSDQIQTVKVDDDYVYIAGFDDVTSTRQWRVEKRNKSTGALCAGGGECSAGAFDTDGIIQSDLDADQDWVTAMAVDSNYLYLAGFQDDDNSLWVIEKRNKSTGALCAGGGECAAGAFDTDGRISETLQSAGDEYPWSIKVDADYVYIAGYEAVNGDDWRIEKRNIETGALCAGGGECAAGAFDTDGIINVNASAGVDTIYAMEINSSYMFVGGYDASSGGGLWRLEKRDLADGSLVTAFDTDGILQEDLASDIDAITGIDLDSDYVYLSGFRDDDAGSWWVEKRDIDDGSLITDFNANGQVVAEDGGNDRATAIQVDDSHVYIAGYGTGAGDNRWIMEKRDITTGLRVSSGFGGEGCDETRTIDTTGGTAQASYNLQTENESTSFSHDYYAFDTDMDVTADEEAAAANINIPITKPDKTKITTVHYAARYMAGAAGSVQLGLKDYAGNNQITGGWTAVAAAETQAFDYNDSIYNMTIALYGQGFNAENYIDTYNKTANLRLRTTAAGGNAYNSTVEWDFAMVSIQWVELTNNASRNYQFSPTGGDLVMGDSVATTSATATSAEGVNTGSWKGTLANDNFHWVVASTTSGMDVQLDFDSVLLNGGNRLIIQTETDSDATAPNVDFQICDWDSSTSVDAVEDTQCNDGDVDNDGAGWRTINTHNNSNASVQYTEAANDSMYWHVYDGYFSTGTTGGTPVSTPVKNFIRLTDGRVTLRYYSTTNTTSQFSIDHARLSIVVDSIYHPSGFTQIAGGTPTGTYTNAQIIGNSATGQQGVTAGDNIYFQVPGASDAISDFYLDFDGVKTYTGANTIYVKAGYRCSTTGISHRPKIYNFNTESWEDLTTGSIACSATEATNAWAKNNITISNYVSNNQIRIGWYGLANGTQAIYLDFVYVMVGTTNNNSAQCEVSFGTGTATDCTNTRDLDSTAASNNLWNNPTEDESTSFGHDYHAFDTDMDATASEEAGSMNLGFSVTRPDNVFISTVHWAGRYRSGAAGTVYMGVKDFSGTTTNATYVHNQYGGWTWPTTNTGGATTALAYVDSITLQTIAVYGTSTNADYHVDTYNDYANLRLRTSAAGASSNGTTNEWDFAMVSLQWIESVDTYEQSGYRFYENADSADVGTPLAALNTSASAPTQGTNFRLRMLVHLSTGGILAEGESFKLQVAQRGVDNQCDTAFSGETYADLSPSSGDIRYSTNSPSDGAALTENANDPTHGTNTIRPQTYEESNNFTNSESRIYTGEDGMWDFVLIDYSASAETTYCMRAVKSDSTVLETYTVIPEFTTVPENIWLVAGIMALMLWYLKKRKEKSV